MNGGKRMKKHLFVIVAVLALMAVIVGCSGETAEEAADSNETAEADINKEGFPIVDEPITVSIFGPNVGAQEWEDMHFFEVMEERTNIQFSFRTPSLDSADTQKNLMFASEDYTDVLFGAGLSQEEQVQYGGQGILIPLEDLIDEYAPNIKRMFEEYPEIEKAITATDGHIYALPQVIMGENWYRGPLWYNGAWLEELGVEELPETTDELYELLVRFKEEDPNGSGEADEIPLTAYISYASR
jgi:putative aldouronate transport system substrate-binding protein